MFSIVIPLDANRLTQFANTKRMYDSFPESKIFLIPTRNMDEVYDYLNTHQLMRDVCLISYKHEIGFNCSKALNIGVRHARTDRVIITSPEVIPNSNVLAQLTPKVNTLCQVYDQDQDGTLGISLVNTTFRGGTPAMYFLACFNRKDILAINGWDEAFMDGYAYEDDDFGNRWVRAGIPFVIRDDLTALHQYHPRAETIPGGWATNLKHLQANDSNGVIRCKRGIKQRKRKVL